MTIYFKDGYVISDQDIKEIEQDPMAEDACIRCGEFSNWSESDLCNNCIQLYEYED